MVRKRSKQSNPEQKTHNNANSQDVEFGQEVDQIQKAKKKYEKTVQPTRSKIHPEHRQSK
ncbi:glycogen biosynthesis protein GlgD [Robertmurraya andreesenii]|uniref:Glycogen biosynthesis protein GlgD n=1 Tax=Anoxybacillus andreesenii TaxID=1325932 RepID=A0ABT9V6P2_9BACL|nr:glycogen biosynthesis protein GlgD [Robertmurraya andreesenii]MDQ0156603.1 hypothetical protein [Robertmurraya andreesenii]